VKNERKMTVSVKSSLNLPPPRVIQRDIEMLKRNRGACLNTIRGYRREISKKRIEQKELWDLSLNPGEYNAEACAKAALRCEGHVGVDEATIKKEQAKVEQLDRMIRTLEERLSLSEQISRSTGNPAPE